MRADEYKDFCAEAQALALEGQRYKRIVLRDAGREVLADYSAADQAFTVIETALGTIDAADPRMPIWIASRWSFDWKANVTVHEALPLREAIEAAKLVPVPRKDRSGRSLTENYASWFKLALSGIVNPDDPEVIDTVARETGLYDDLFDDGFHIADNGCGEFDHEGVHFHKPNPEGGSHWRIGTFDVRRGLTHPSQGLWYAEHVDDSGRRVCVANLHLKDCLKYERIDRPSADQQDGVVCFDSWEHYEETEDRSFAPSF